MHILITSVPPGEAPHAVRQEWVGLRLPLHPNAQGLMHTQTVGVVSGRPSWWRRLLGFKTSALRKGYLVPYTSALEILSTRSPQAAEWWRNNTRYSADEQACLFFHESCCAFESPAIPEDTSELGDSPFIVDRG